MYGLVVSFSFETYSEDYILNVDSTGANSVTHFPNSGSVGLIF